MSAHQRAPLSQPLPRHVIAAARRAYMQPELCQNGCSQQGTSSPLLHTGLKTAVSLLQDSGQPKQMQLCRQTFHAPSKPARARVQNASSPNEANAARPRGMCPRPACPSALALTDPDNSALLGDTLESDRRMRDGPVFVIDLRQSCGEQVQICCIHYAHDACLVGGVGIFSFSFPFYPTRITPFGRIETTYMILPLVVALRSCFQPVQNDKNMQKGTKAPPAPGHAMHPDPMRPPQCN